MVVPPLNVKQKKQFLKISEWILLKAEQYKFLSFLNSAAQIISETPFYPSHHSYPALAHFEILNSKAQTRPSISFRSSSSFYSHQLTDLDPHLAALTTHIVTMEGRTFSRPISRTLSISQTLQ